MNIGHRIFVIEEDAIFPISQKTLTELYSGKVGALPKFAGQTVQIAVVVYTVHQRKPKTIIQIDSERIRIMGDGSIDENYEHEGLHLAANRMWLSEANPKSSGNVVDAKARFEERQWDQRHPKLSGPSYKRILAGSRYFCESFFGHPCPTSGKNYATANAFGGPSRPASLVAYPTRGMQHSYAMTRRDFVKPAFSLRYAP